MNIKINSSNFQTISLFEYSGEKKNSGTQTSTTTKVFDISTYDFHPNSTGFFWKILNSFIEFFTGKTAVQIIINPNSRPVYVKVNELCQILGVKKRDLLKEINGHTTVEISSYIKMQALAKHLNLIIPENSHHLQNLANKISFPTILHLLETRPNDEDKKILLQTFVKIDQELRVGNPTEAYFKSIKKDQKVQSFAFEISQNHLCFVIPKSKGGLIGEGTYKEITAAYKIDDFARQSFSEQVEAFVRIKPNKNVPTNPDGTPKYTTEGINAELVKEAKDIREILADIPHAIEPALFQGLSPGGKMVFFQKKYTGDGEKLATATLPHQLNALKHLATALTLLHQKDWVHLDVKPANLLWIGDLTDENNPVSGKIADIGMINRKGALVKGGTDFYLPPETLIFNLGENGLETDEKGEVLPGQIEINDHCLVTTKIDSYGLGISILETVILPENVPFFALLTNEEEFEAYLNNFIAEQQQKIADHPDVANRDKRIELLSICYNLLRFDPRDRISCQQAADMLTNIQEGKSAF